VNAAETVRRQWLARTPLADFFRFLLDKNAWRERSAAIEIGVMTR
jgi:hypothetical protein